jgi:lipoic acid synthetase
MSLSKNGNEERFDSRPQVVQSGSGCCGSSGSHATALEEISGKKKRLNVLPNNPEMSDPDRAVGPGRFPSWLHRKLPKGANLWKTGKAIEGERLHTVCEEARCPNLLECWSKKTATFLAMGKECTRNCGFCSIDFAKAPKPLEEDEPLRIARSIQSLGLNHAVITMVARDDLADGGAAHLAKIIQAVRTECPETTIEVLTSDFQGDESSIQLVIEARPDIFNYNIETVRRLSPRVRHKATYERTLNLLKYVSSNRSIPVKSGIMVGLGETEEEIYETIKDLYSAGVQIITIGQYLQSDPRKLLVKEFVTPEQFELYREYGEKLGVGHMYCGPFVRSSYNAGEVLIELRKKRELP